MSHTGPYPDGFAIAAHEAVLLLAAVEDDGHAVMDRRNTLICGAALFTELDIKDHRPHCENGAPYARAEVFFCWLDRSGVATLGTGVALIFEQWASGGNALEGR